MTTDRATVSELSGLLGLSAISIRRHLARGQIEKGDDGKYDVLEVKAYVEARHATDKRNVSTTATTLKEKKIEAELRLLDLRFQRLAGDLVPVSEVEAGWVEIAAQVRQRLEMIPGSVAPLMEGLTTAQRCDVLAREIKDALSVMAKEGE